MSFVVLESVYAVFDPVGGAAGERAAVDGDATLRGAGCTAAAVTLRPGVATIAWAGDVHVLLLGAGSTRAVTREHSLLNEASNLSPSHQQKLRKVIVRALGMTRELDVEVQTSAVEPGDIFALLSDGLLEALGEDVLVSLARAHQNDLDAGVRALIDAGKANGGRGALTAVLVAVGYHPPSRVAGRSEVA